MSSPGRLEALVPWVPVMVGVGIMVGLLIAAFALSPAGTSTATGLPRLQSPTQPSGQGQSLGAEDGLGVGGASPLDPHTASLPMSRSVTPSRPSTGTGAPGSGTAGSGGTSAGGGSGATSLAPQPPVVIVVSGRYRVLNSYVDSFIGEVLVSNSSSSPHDWVVQLRFPSNVGSLRTSWVESQPQATLTRSGQTFIWTSTVPVGAGSSVALRFQFARTGTNSNPATCTVNGTACSGL
jgi:hypothetical protein